ncbi:MAG: BNR-4 repeat-containing protein [Armatimonadota bacterium]|jgi:hypothetical protein
MHSFRLTSFALTLAVFSTAAFAATIPPSMRGARTVHIVVDEPGPMTLTVLKRDLNIYEGEDLLHLSLYDPLGTEILSHTMPDDGNAGRGGRAEDYQRFEQTVDCALAGTYRLGGRGSGDLVWGVETTTEKLVVQGPTFFSDGDVSGSVYFPPPSDEFSITISALHDPGRQTVPLYDADGRHLRDFELTVTGEEHTMQFPAAEREGLWRMDIERMTVRLEIEGVEFWTSDPNAWFDAGASKWMLLPYRFTRYLQPGEAADLEFSLRNSTGAPDRLRIDATTPPALDLHVIEPRMPVRLEDGEIVTVTLRVTLADDAQPEDGEHQVFLRASAEAEPSAVASSGITVRVGESPVSRPLNMPIRLRPFAHENVQFGYDPDYMRNEAYFDAQNIPWIRHRTESMYGTTGVYALDDDLQWVHRGFEDVIREKYPEYGTSYGGGGFAGAKLAFDAEGGVYTTLRLVAGNARPAVLLFSPDEGRSWEIHELRGNVAEIEQFTGHNTLDIPPPVLAYETTAPHPARFCSYNDLWLYMPRREGDTLIIGEPIQVAEAVIGSCQHSGGPASSATANGKTHIVWGEVSGEPDGSEADERGVPTYAATYDHVTGAVGEKVLLGYGPPVNDVHNVPAITMDSEGYLHVLIGAHGRPFHYVRSLQPNDATAWTEAEPILSTGYATEGGEEGRQTYISLVCDADDTLHTAFRQWRNDEQYHDGNIFAALSVQHRPKDGEWSREATPLVIPAVSGYSIYYHKLTIDRLGDLWVSYSYWTSDETYQDHFPDRYHHRAVIVSRDGGETWKLAETADFIEGIGLVAAD